MRIRDVNGKTQKGKDIKRLTDLVGKKKFNPRQRQANLCEFEVNLVYIAKGT